jgi:NADH-quinone oxidoreductase subunit I
LAAHQQSDPTAAGRRSKVSNVLDRFTIDWGLCMFCGICVQVCPFGALEWAAEPIAATGRRAGLRTPLFESGVWPARD